VLAFAKALLAISLLFAAPDMGVGGDAGADAPVAAAEPAPPEAHPIDLKAASDHPQITLGESFNYVIEVVHDSADTYALPQASTMLAAALGKGSLELRGEPTVTRATDPQKPSLAKTTLTIPLADVASMKPGIPALELEVQGPSGARVLHLPEQTLTVESLVAKEGEPNAEHAHHGPKPPEQIKVRSYLWLWLLLGLGAIAAAIYAFQKLRMKQAEKAAEPAPPERADHEAQRRMLAVVFGRGERGHLRALGDRPHLSREGAPLQRHRSDQRGADSRLGAARSAGPQFDQIRGAGALGRPGQVRESGADRAGVSRLAR